MSMTLPADTLIKFPNRVFVETGTNVGDCVSLALECGFGKVISIEKSDHYFCIAAARFAGDDRVELIHGDSASAIRRVLLQIAEPVTFWLDSHCTPGLPLSAEGPCPILNEIAAIGEHSIKSHTILIDDISCFSTPVLDNITVKQLQDALLLINDGYTFSFEQGKFAGDVMAATVSFGSK